MAEFKVVEMFTSINGEGPLAGQLSVFVRFQGCNLRCTYCDTAWANQENTPYHVMTENDIYKEIKKQHVNNVTITGGEPLLQPDIKELFTKLAQDKELHVEIETNGSISVEPFLDIENRPAMTLDYKLAGSGMESHMDTDNFSWVDSRDAVKFVCSNIEDVKRAQEIMNQYGLNKKCNVFLSPVFGKIDPADMVEYMKKHEMNGVRLQLQLHKFIWDPDRRGV